MSRPKKTEQERRRAIIGVRFTLDERQIINGEADICGLSISSFIRAKSLGKRIAPKTDLKVLAELRRLGGLLKHIHNETNGIYSVFTTDCLKEIAAYTRKLSAEIDRGRGDRK